MTTKEGSEKKVMMVYNPSNHLITDADIVLIFRKCEIDYHPNNLSLFQRGLTHQSYVMSANEEFIYERLSDCVELQPDSNERLEYLGDSVIGAVTSAYLCRRYPLQDEGFLTKIKTKLVRTAMLAKYSAYLGLDRHVLISKHVEDNCNGRTNERILEDTFEAFIGAVFEDVCQSDLDCGYGCAMQMCYRFLIRVMEDTTDFRPLISINDNYKELLLQFYHKHWIGCHPIYYELNAEGKMNHRIYTMGVNHPETGQLIGQGTAQKKTTAEQLASKQALEYFEKNPPRETRLK